MLNKMIGYKSFLIHLGNAIIWNLFIGAILWFLFLLIKQLVHHKDTFHNNFSFAAISLLGLFFVAATLYFNLGTNDFYIDYFNEVSNIFVTQKLAWTNINIISYLIYGIGLIYIIGLLLQIIKWPFVLKRQKTLYSIFNQQVPETIHSFIEKQKQILNIRKKVIVYLIDGMISPVTIGFIKPIILLPVASITNLSTSAIEAILVPELAHIRRNDYLINFIASILQSILFFNPFINYFLREMNTSREIICDRYVLQQLYSPMFYADGLLQLSKVSNPQLAPVLSMPAIQKNGTLLLRIQHIVQFGKLPKPVSILHNTKILMAGFYVLLGMAMIYCIPFNEGYKKNTVQHPSNKNDIRWAIADKKLDVIPLQLNENRSIRIRPPKKQLLVSTKHTKVSKYKSINPIIDKSIELNDKGVNNIDDSQNFSIIPVKQLLSSAINENDATQASFKIKQVSAIHYNHSTTGYRMYFIQEVVNKQTQTTEPSGYILEVQKQIPGIDGEVHIVREYYGHLYPNTETKLNAFAPVMNDSTLLNNLFN
jgi:beta-lactamase regulating signal transducer with metallopeptidase domain